MQLIIVLLIAAASGLAGIAVGWFLRFIIALGRRGSMELEIKEMMLTAREQAEKITKEAEKKADIIKNEAKAYAKKEEERIQKTEDRLVNKESLLDKRQIDLDAEFENQKEKYTEIEALRVKLENEIDKKTEELQKVSDITREEAKKMLLAQLEKDYSEDLAVRIQKLSTSNREVIDKKAKEILATAIQRLGTAVPTDIFSSIIDLKNEEVKGKIIGKEGRNIKTFERLTGVEIIIDDTPGIITLSSYDPVRREIAKVALESLISDGRIQPAKIEHYIEKAQKEVNEIIRKQGEKAAYECGVFDLDPKLLIILGRLHYRTSYGQNILQHSIEMAHLAGMLAEEIGGDAAIAKAGALLHDIGKAIDHEVAGSHLEIGRRILQKFNVDERIIKAMQAHHEDYPFETVESVIVYVCDHISGGRPGARRDNAENYIKRLSDLEAIANAQTGVVKSYAIQAGRELRIFVNPESVSDAEAAKIARNIALKIEKEIKYPGEIRITVIRENKIVEYAR
jgi:ribonuclease Y